MAAGAIIETTTGSTVDPKSKPKRWGVQKITLAWTSDASGNVTAIPTATWVEGELLRVVFVPNGGGTAPSNLYDVLLKDENGVDVLGGQGANLSDTVVSHVCPGVPLKDGTTTSTRPSLVCGFLTLDVTNAGNAKGGTVVLYVR
jgi:hypothetical protein